MSQLKLFRLEREWDDVFTVPKRKKSPIKEYYTLQKSVSITKKRKSFPDKVNLGFHHHYCPTKNAERTLFKFK